MQPTNTIELRKQQFVEAVILGAHAHQARYREETGRGDAAAFAFPGSSDTRNAMAATFSRLMSAKTEAVKDWLTRGSDSHIEIPHTPPFTTVQDAVEQLTSVRLKLAPGLPFSVAADHLRHAAPQAPVTHVRAVASLYQIVLYIMLDAVELQDVFRHYLAMELPVSLEELGLVCEREAYIAMGKELSPKCCACPFDVTPNDWHLASRKLRNWGDKYRGKVTAETMARELLATPEVRDCASGLRMLPPQRLVVCGHSFTMSLHWASPGSFTDIAGRIVRHFNPDIEWLHLGRGSLTPTIARKQLLDQVIQQRPDQTILVTICNNEENRSDLKYAIQRLQEHGSKVIVFDSVMVYPEIYEREKLAVKAAREAGATVIEVYPLLDSHPLRAEFPALDEIHTAPPYHKVMAVELVRFLAGKRRAALPA